MVAAYVMPQGLVSRACEVAEAEVDDWKRVHVEFERIAKKRAALDREELALIREAIRIALWRHVGATSIREYLENVCGYGPHVASERVRVAEALDGMPALELALDAGELSYSAVRAITRIATNRTEDEWIAACRGKNQRQIEELLAEREVGDRPDTLRKPDLRAKDRTYRGITPATEAALELARRRLQEELGERLDDNQLLAMLAERVCSGSAPRKRAAAQIAVTVCPSCQVGRQLAGNRQIALRPEELARRYCDAEWIDVTGKQRAVQDVTPALRAKVMMRDHAKCRVPGCRAAANIEVHHIIPWNAGGTHTMENLLCLCDGHHVAHHRGDISIEGPAPTATIVNIAAQRADAVVHGDKGAEQIGEVPAAVVPANDEREPVVHVDNPSDHSDEPGEDAEAPDRSSELAHEAMLVLTGLGYKKRDATRAVRAALANDPQSLDELVRTALRCCLTLGS